MGNIYNLFSSSNNLGTATIAPIRSIFNLSSINGIIGNDWNSNASSAFLNRDQLIFDMTLYNNLDIISSQSSFEKIKNYELKFGLSSEKFLEQWEQGLFPSNPLTHDWAATLKNLRI